MNLERIENREPRETIDFYKYLVSIGNNEVISKLEQLDEANG